MSDFVAVAKVADIEDPGRQLVEVDEQLVVVLKVAGEFFALDDHLRLYQASLITVLAMLLSTLALFSVEDRSDRLKLLGTVGCGSTCVMIATPMLRLREVLRKRSTAGLPFQFCLASVVMNMSWTFYAWRKHDMFVLLANGVGSVGALVQLSLFAIDYLFWRSRSETGLAKKGAMELEE